MPNIPKPIQKRPPRRRRMVRPPRPGRPPRPRRPRCTWPAMPNYFIGVFCAFDDEAPETDRAGADAMARGMFFSQTAE